MDHSTIERNANLITSYNKIERKIKIEKAIIIAEISILGLIIVWILALYWLSLRNAEKDFFKSNRKQTNFYPYDQESSILKNNSILKFLVLILCIPFYGAGVLFVFSIITFGLLPAYLYSLWTGRINKFDQLTKAEINQIRYPSASYLSQQLVSGSETRAYYSAEESRLKEIRKEKLAKLMERSSRINKDDFIALMEFNTPKQFMNWIIDLPKDSPLRLEGDQIVFSTDQKLTENERLSTASQLVDDIEKSKSCYYCGSLLVPNQNYCQDCGKRILECPICKQVIQFGDTTGTCLYCDNNYHYSHFAEWLKVRGKCAICNESMLEGEIIEKQSGRAKK